MTGVHALLESARPDYVRKRCLQHLPWRVADAGTRAMPHFKATEAANVYLRDGVTWRRLGAIAVQSVAQGGLGLFRDGSREYKKIFGTSPPRLIDQRPECTVDFIAWLLPKQSVLAQCAAVDLQQRDLNFPQVALALQTLSNRKECVLRHLDAILLKKSLYFAFLNNRTIYCRLGSWLRCAYRKNFADHYGHAG